MAQLSVYTGPTSNSDNQLRLQQAQRSTAYDPVDKLRVSTPQSLIDTDFEYGQQPSKWEQLALQNNRQSLYYIGNAALPVNSIAGNQSNTYQLVIGTSANVTVPTGTPIFIEDTLDANANGWAYVVAGVTAGTSFTVQVAQSVTTSVCWNATATYVYQGYTYSGCGITLTGTAAFTFVGSTVTCTTTYPHGLSAASLIFITGTTGPSTATQINGSQIVATVPTANSFTFTNVNGTPSTTIANTAGQTNLFARPSGWVESRAFDGSVNFTAGAAVPNQQLMRQTRRYFRYQSGKGIQFSTGTILKPYILEPIITSSGSIVTVVTKFPHNLTTGTYVQVSGADQSAYNGIFRITVTNLNTFTYPTLNNAIPSASPATSTSGFLRVSPYSWYGSRNRVGFCDMQNGLFFEFDGQTLYAVYRNSINQITGTVSVTQNSPLVTGTNTQFTTQLTPGDYIIIRGQSYRVLTILTDTSMYLSNEYRGSTISNALVSKTIDQRVPQSQWYDVLDGSNSASNPSGYNLDLTRVQMWYIDYSWYGAGVARFGLRTTSGTIQYVYNFQNNNINYSAYMRSGNLPSHYEQAGILPITTITASIAAVDTSINVASTAGFNPLGGTLKVTASGVSGVVEYMTYSGFSAGATTLSVARAATGGAATAQAFTYSASAPVTVEYASPDTAATLSHWGSSVVMDGGFNNDVSLFFNYGMLSPLITTSSSTSYPIMAIRVAPSVDNGTVGTLGVKEIVNRLQLQLRELAVYTTGAYLVQFILNGIVSGSNFTGFTSPNQNGTNTSSIVQVATNTNVGTTITGGESVAAFYTNANSQTTLDLTSLSSFGNCILGGGTSNSVPTSQAGTYPDGPDILYVVVTCFVATSTNIQARITWQESQA